LLTIPASYGGYQRTGYGAQGGDDGGGFSVGGSQQGSQGGGSGGQRVSSKQQAPSHQVIPF
jgi:replication factor A2